MLNDPSAIVRRAILAERSITLPVFHFEDLLQLADDVDVEVRQLATERLLATRSLNRLFPGPLEERISHETNASLRRQLLVQCLKADGSRRLVALSQQVPSDLTLEILNVLIDYEVQIEWEYLAPLGMAHDPTFDILLTKLMRASDTTQALPWLLHGMARAFSWPQPHNRPEANTARDVHELARFAEQSLLDALPQIQEIRDARLEPPAVQAAMAYLRHEIEQLEGCIWDEEEMDDEPEMDAAWYERAVSERRQLISALEHAI